MFASLYTGPWAATLVSLIAVATATPMWVNPSATGSDTINMAPPYRPPRPHHQLLQQRGLAPGDFDDFALLYQEATVTIEGEFTVERTGATITLYNIVCRNIYLSDLTWEYSEPDAQTLRIQAAFVDITAACDVDFDYSVGFGPLGTSGSGTAGATVADANSLYQLDFIAVPSLDANPPQATSLTDCMSSATLEAFNIGEFDGPALVRNILNEVGENFLSEQLSTFLCNLQQPIEDAAGRILEINDILEPYLGEQDRQNADPLGPEKDLLPLRDPNVMLVEYNDPNTTFSIAVGEIIDQARDRLAGESFDENTNQTDLTVNILIRDQLYNEEGRFALDFSSFSTGALFDLQDNDFIELELRLLSVSVANLDQFTRFNLLELIGNYTFSTSLAIPNIDFEAVFELVLRPPDDTTDANSFVQTFTTQVTLSNIDVSVAFLLAIDENRIETLRLGSVLDTGSLVDCLLSFLYDAEVSVFDVGEMSIDRPSVFGFASPGFERVVPTAVETGYDMFRSILDEALPNVIENVVFDTVNTELDKYTTGENQCPEVDYEGMTEFIDFRDLLLLPADAELLGGSGDQPYGDLAAIAKGFLDRLLETDETTGLSKINGFVIDKWTEESSGTEGVLVYDGNLIDIDGNVSSAVLQAELQLRAYNARIDGLNTLTEPLELLAPINGQRTHLNNSASIGSEDRPVRLSLTLYLRLRTGDAVEYIENEMDLSLDIYGLTVVAPIVAEIVEGVLLSYPIDDVLDFNCILASIPPPLLDERGIRLPGVAKSLGLLAFELLVNKIDFDVNCISCTSPKFEKISVLLKQDPDSKDVTDTVNAILDLVSEYIGGEFLQTVIDRELIEAPRKCSANRLFEPGANRTEYEPFAAIESDDSAQRLLLAVLLLCAGIMACAYGIRAGISWIVGKRNKEWLKTLPPKRVLAMFKQQQKEDAREDTLNSLTTSMFKSEVVPVFVRYFVPVVMVGNAGLFLSGHISTGGTITVIGSLGGERVELGNLFEFSIADSVIDLWNAGGYALALTIAVFSGFWPYMKLAVTMSLWFLPPEKVSISRRGRIFITLDALSKWSMVDVFVIVVSLVSYQKSITSPNLSYLPEELYTLDLIVIPVWGLYANLLAQIVAQVTSTYIIHYHRRVVEVATKQMNKNKQVGNTEIESASDHADHIAPTTSFGSKEPVPKNLQTLRHHKYYRVDQGTDEVLKVKRGVTPGMLLLIAIAFLFYIIGCSVKAFSLETLGFFGLLIESGRGFEEATDEYSVFGIASFLMDQADFLGTSKDTLGHLLMASVLIITVLIVPCVQLGLMCFQWLYPMGRILRNRVLTAIEILQAWQYSEVFLVALLVGTLQVGQISSLIVKQFCADLDSTFASLEYYGIIDERDATCFGQEARVLGGFYVLVFATVLLALLETFVITASLHWQRDTSSSSEVPVVSEEELASLPDGEGMGEIMGKVRPPPILFTDRFRWLLVPEEFMV